MKLKASVILLLLSLSAFILPLPVQAAGLSLSPMQGIVGSEITIIAIGTYGSGEYQILWGEEKQIVVQGTTQSSTNVNFTVPEAARGKHLVTLKIAGKVVDTEYTVLPSLKLSIASGMVNSNLTVSGSGFSANEPGINVLYDGIALVTGVVADNKGGWQGTFKIPLSQSGAHTIDASGNTTPSTEIEDKKFTVIPKIDINPVAGGVGTMVIVYATGFSKSETGIAIAYDGKRVKTAIASDSTGTWQSSFFIPSSTKGRHRINCYGGSTVEEMVAPVYFNVAPVLRVELASGLLGDAILVGDDFFVSGIGFEENEGEIRVTYDGQMLASGIIADATGSWAVQLKVPVSARGKHVIDASGSTTRAEDVADGKLAVSPHIVIDPIQGGVGTEVVVKGNGFNGTQLITLTYDGTPVASGLTADARGGFTATFKVPKGKAGGDHTILVTDAQASVATALFKTETTPPPAPKPLQPEAGTKLGMIGDTIVTFSWAPVADPSGVSYVLEVSESPNFTGAVLRKDNLIATEYTLSQDEALPQGAYYWRVRAVDGIGNESAWTNGQLFRVGGKELWLFGSILGGIIVLGLIIWRILVVSRKGWK